MSKRKPTHVLAIDPGKATGFAAWNDRHPSEFDFVGEASQFDVCRVAEDWMTTLTGTVHKFRPLLVIEKFTITPETAKKSRQYEALEITGSLRYMAHDLGVPLEIQTPAQAKRFAPNKRLRQMGLYHGTKGGHANDAARHLCLALSKHGCIRPTPITTEGRR